MNQNRNFILLLIATLVLGLCLAVTSEATAQIAVVPEKQADAPPPTKFPAKKSVYSIYEIPMPRPKGWITDLTGKVSAESVEHINMVCQELNERLDREMTVVVVPSIGEKSEPGPESAHRKYATSLFNYWGVGKKGLLSGIYRDNGTLLFVAIDDKAAEIVLGKGIDGREELRVANSIVQDTIVPLFVNQDPDSALYEGTRAIATRIYSVTDLDSPVMLPSVSKSGRKAIKPNRPRRRQRGPITWLPFIGIGGLVGGVGLIVGGRYYMRYRPRHCPSCSDEMIRLEEDQEDVFLEQPEQVEEWLGSVDYDVWGCPKCEEILKLRYGKLFTRYSKCPDCWYITVLTVKDVLRRATYTRGGQVQVVEDCKNCNYHKSYIYRTPRKVKSSSGSSSFGSGRSGGFSSGGGGFGGGSSSGGGASGRW